MKRFLFWALAVSALLVAFIFIGPFLNYSHRSGSQQRHIDGALRTASRLWKTVGNQAKGAAASKPQQGPPQVGVATARNAQARKPWDGSLLKNLNGSAPGDSVQFALPSDKLASGTIRHLE